MFCLGTYHNFPYTTTLKVPADQCIEVSSSLPECTGTFEKGECIREQDRICPGSYDPEPNCLHRCETENPFQYPDADKDAKCESYCGGCLSGFILQPDGTCECPKDGYYVKDGQCIQIPTCAGAEVWDSDLQKCVCNEPNHTVSGMCVVCSPPYYVVEGQCVECKSPFVRNDDGTCECPAPMHMIGSECVACATPFVIENNQCQCPEGEIQENDTCVQGSGPGPDDPSDNSDGFPLWLLILIIALAVLAALIATWLTYRCCKKEPESDIEEASSDAIYGERDSFVAACANSEMQVMAGIACAEGAKTHISAVDPNWSPSDDSITARRTTPNPDRSNVIRQGQVVEYV
jgi:hypothetical protein